MHFKDKSFTFDYLKTLLILNKFLFFIIDKIKETKIQKQITNLYHL